MKYKNPESVLVVIYCQTTKRCLMMQRQDDPSFWQSVTGSLEMGEKPYQTAIREVKEETGFDILRHAYPLIDIHYSIEFEIFPQFRHRYHPNVSTNREHWFYLLLPEESTPSLTEHLAYQWLSIEQAIVLTPSWNNRQAIEQIREWLGDKTDKNI
ncbi:dihydroneopterin triphosphate diphosphatase [Orbus mooreae]|uniref:dihydroneopterin triphosphate diphosphatase n=1 Tax=Orbus mooreae TaxID=3074107 RepID=UPI00370DC4CC